MFSPFSSSSTAWIELWHAALYFTAVRPARPVQYLATLRSGMTDGFNPQINVILSPLPLSVA